MAGRRRWFSGRDPKENEEDSAKWFESQAKKTEKILEHQEFLRKENLNLTMKLMQVQSNQRELTEQNKQLLSTVSELQKTISEVSLSSMLSSSTVVNTPQPMNGGFDPIKLRIEVAHSFTTDKFASTFDTLRRTQVPPSHTLCFYYTSEKGANKIVETGVIPCVEECGGVPLSMIGPDDNEHDLRSRWATALTLDCEEVVFVLAVPMRLLWAFPESPDDSPSLESRLHGPYRVLPSRLIQAASDSSDLPIRQIGKRAYSLVDFSNNENDEFSNPNNQFPDEFDMLEADDFNSSEYDGNGNNISSPRYNDVRMMGGLSISGARPPAPSKPLAVTHIKSFIDYADKVNEVRQYCVVDGSKIMLYHYTNITHAASILSGGLRMSTQGQGDGGVYFSMLGPASYGFGSNPQEDIRATNVAALSLHENREVEFEDQDLDQGVDLSQQDDYEARLIIDCYGKERLSEYYGKGLLSLVLVCAIDEGILSPAPGGRTNALMVTKEIFETLGTAKSDGHFHLPPSCIRAALHIDPDATLPVWIPPSPPHTSSSNNGRLSAYSVATTMSSFSSIRSPFSLNSGATNIEEEELVTSEIARDQENMLRANKVMKKLRQLTGSNSLAIIPSAVPDIPSAFLPRSSIIEAMKEVLLPNYSNPNLGRFEHLATTNSLQHFPAMPAQQSSSSIPTKIRSLTSDFMNSSHHSSSRQISSDNGNAQTPPLASSHQRLTLNSAGSSADMSSNKHFIGSSNSFKNNINSLNASSNSIMTTSKRKVGLRTCVLQGMGGMGKSTMVASFAHDTEVRSAFDKIVWISLGQTPDINALQESVHLQLTGEPIPASVNLLPASIIPEQRKTALKSAAREASSVLCILDDVWDPAHEKEFNFLNRDSGSALLISTRIRGLLKNNAVEIMAVALEKEAALSLLLAKAGINEEYLEVGSEEYILAQEVVSLTGCLPLTISIAAGLIEANGSEVTPALVNMMKEDRLRSNKTTHGSEEVGSNTLISGSGGGGEDHPHVVNLEDRLITASLRMFKGRFEHLATSCFLSFAAFPEDCAVPSVVFDVLAPYLVSQSQVANQDNLSAKPSPSSSKVEFREVEETKKSSSGTIHLPPSEQQKGTQSMSNLLDKPKLDAVSLWKNAAVKARTLDRSKSHVNVKKVVSVRRFGANMGADGRGSGGIEGGGGIGGGGNNASRRRQSIRSSISSMNRNKDMVDVRKCLTDLVRVNLCSGNFIDGFYVHDIIRDYVVARHEKSELVTFQQGIVNVLLEFCSSNENAATDMNANNSQKVKKESRNFLLHYIHENLRWHMSEVIKSTQNLESIPKHWYQHPSLIVQKSLAMALDVEGIQKLAHDFESGGKLVDAAKICYLSKQISSHFSSHDEYVVMIRQACKLLEKAKDTSEFALEVDMILTGLTLETSHVFIELTDRLAVIIEDFNENRSKYKVNNHECFQAAWAKTVVMSNMSRREWRLGKTLSNEEQIGHMINCIVASKHAATLALNKAMFHYLHDIYAPAAIGFQIYLFADSKSENFLKYLGTRDGLFRALDAYQYEVWHPIFKTSGKNQDIVMSASFVPIIGYYYRCQEMLNIWSIKTLNAFQSSIDKTNGLISHLWFEVYGCIVSGLPVLLEMKGGKSLQPFFKVFGFTTKNSPDKFKEFWNDPGRGIIGTGEGLSLFTRLLILLSSPQLVQRDYNLRCTGGDRYSVSGGCNTAANSGGTGGGTSGGSNLNQGTPITNRSSSNRLDSYFEEDSSDGELDISWIPAAEKIVSLEKEFFLLGKAAVGSAVLFALRIYLTLEKYEEAVELATLGLVDSLKPNVKVSCYLGLGRVALVQGRKLDALEHYDSASKVAKNNSMTLPYLMEQVEKDKKLWMATYP